MPFRLPDRGEEEARPRSLLHVLYLIFSEGYASSGGAELNRPELSDEAIRLTRMVHRMLQDNVEVMALLALMLLLDARGGAALPHGRKSHGQACRAALSGGARRAPQIEYPAIDNP